MCHLVTHYLRDSANVPKVTPSSKKAEENRVKYDSLPMCPISCEFLQVFFKYEINYSKQQWPY